MVHAFVDESFGNIGQDRVYIVAAACLDSRELDSTRRTIRDLNPYEGKLHWHRERSETRHALLTAMALLPVRFHIVVRTSVYERPERQRRLCLKALLSEIKALGLQEAVLESRGAVGDRRDRAALDWQARTGPSPTSIRHSPGVNEPLLWLADFVCGATWSRVNGNDSYVPILEKMNIASLALPGT